MLTILINAYACGPGRGSEPGMAWNWCLNLARYCNLHIITEGEFREDIDRVLPSLKQGANMHFYFLPVSDKIRNMCWNQGDWRFYYYYARWQKRALKQAQEIIKATHVDVIHQLNMVGFREPGYLWKLEKSPIIWGPIGGMEQTPVKFINNFSFGNKVKVIIKNALNEWQRKHGYRVVKMIKRADYVITATKEAYGILSDYHKKENVVHINETGCKLGLTPVHKSEDGLFEIVWCGRFIPTKRLDIALSVIRLLNHLDVRLHIIGTGSSEDVKLMRRCAEHINIEEKLVWHGQIKNDEVQRIMQKADLFFFTSIKETTSTVILEAIQNGLPILCFDAFGFGPIVDSSIGVKIPLSTPQQSIKDFAEKIDYLYHHRKELQYMSEGCAAKQKELSWESKALQMFDIYKKAISSYKDEKN